MISPRSCARSAASRSFHTCSASGVCRVQSVISPTTLSGELLRYDRVPARLEAYGPGLLEAIDAGRPELSVFGHVHQPQARRLRRGRTECVNVGHFARVPVPYEITVGAR